MATITLEVLILTESGRPLDDPRIQLVLHPVGRIAASLRAGRWNDFGAPVKPFKLHELGNVVRSFHPECIYGGRFFDVPIEDDFQKWSDRLSLDTHLDPDSHKHSMILFQEKPDRHLDICIWFDELSILSSDGRELDPDDIITGGQRFWDGLFP